MELVAFRANSVEKIPSEDDNMVLAHGGAWRIPGIIHHVDLVSIIDYQCRKAYITFIFSPAARRRHQLQSNHPP